MGHAAEKANEGVHVLDALVSLELRDSGSIHELQKYSFPLKILDTFDPGEDALDHFKAAIGEVLPAPSINLSD